MNVIVKTQDFGMVKSAGMKDKYIVIPFGDIELSEPDIIDSGNRISDLGNYTALIDAPTPSGYCRRIFDNADEYYIWVNQK